jgi:hypothetical protein
MTGGKSVWLPLCALLLLAGCYRGPGTENPANTRYAPYTPWGVIASKSDPAEALRDGLYLGRTQYSCCGLGKEANLRIAAPNRPRHVFFRIFVPDFSDFTHKKTADQTIEVVFSAKHHPVFRGLTAGHTDFFEAPIPSDARIVNEVLFIKLRMGYATAPAQFKPGGDPRPYSIILRDAETGA